MQGMLYRYHVTLRARMPGTQAGCGLGRSPLRRCWQRCVSVSAGQAHYGPACLLCMGQSKYAKGLQAWQHLCRTCDIRCLGMLKAALPLLLQERLSLQSCQSLQQPMCLVGKDSLPAFTNAACQIRCLPAGHSLRRPGSKNIQLTVIHDTAVRHWCSFCSLALYGLPCMAILQNTCRSTSIFHI